MMKVPATKPYFFKGPEFILEKYKEILEGKSFYQCINMVKFEQNLQHI